MTLRHIFLILFVFGAACAIYLWKDLTRPTSPQANQSQTRETSQSPIRYPVPSEQTSHPLPSPPTSQKVLPTLDDSDQTIQDALSGLFGKIPLESYLNLQGFIRRFVITVDNSTGQHPVPPDAIVFVPVSGRFRTQGKGENQVINPANFKRYSAYTSLIEKVTSKNLVSVYVHYYPLFQAAYRDLSPKGNFNDRLIEVIDHLLKTPDIKLPIKVTPNSVSFKFEDPSLEGLSTAQKVLLRIGPENEKIIKTKLQELRELLTHF